MEYKNKKKKTKLCITSRSNSTSGFETETTIVISHERQSYIKMFFPKLSETKAVIIFFMSFYPIRSVLRRGSQGVTFPLR